MYLGTQIRPRDNSDYRVWAQLGVTHVCVDPPGNPHDWSLDDLIRKAALPGDRFACPGVPCDQLDEQIVAVSQIAVDVGPRQSNLGRNVVHRGLVDSVAINAAFSGGQDALARIVGARRCDWLTGRSSRHRDHATRYVSRPVTYTWPILLGCAA